MKQIFTRFLMLTAMIMTVASVVAQKTVLNESFASGQKPEGWMQTAEFWKFEAGSVEFDVQTGNTVDTLITPVVSIIELDNEPSVTITYTNLANGGRVNTLYILYRTAVTEEWRTIESISTATTDKTILTKTLPDGLAKVQLALVAISNAGGKTSVYNVTIGNKKEATDPPTGLRIDDITTTSATIFWNPCTSLKFEHYNLKISTKPLTNPSDETADVVDMIGFLAYDFTDEFFELDNLTPNTVYYVYVQYDCGDSDLSPWAETSFQTSCPAIGVPHYEDFETDLSVCYTIFKQGSATTATVSSEYPYNSTKSFKFVMAKGFYNYLVLPELNTDVHKYQVSFMAAAQETGQTYARTISVGVCTSSADVAGTFTEVATFNLPAGRKWEEITISLANYKGDGKYIAFRAGNADKENRIFIDNINVDLASACPKPMFVTVSAITPNSAQLAWNKAGSETEWNLVVSTKRLSDPEDITPDAAMGEYAGSISQNPYTITGLVPSTDYYVYLQAGCGSSEWTEAYSFKTAKEVAYPYFESFDRLASDAYNGSTYSADAMPEGWVADCRYNNVLSTNWDRQYISSSYMPFVTTAQNNKTTAYVNASLVLKGTSITAGSTTSTGYTSIVMLPAMKKDLNQTQITMWVYSAATMTLNVGVAKTQTADLEQGKQLGENITTVSEIPIAANSKWTKVTCSLAEYKGDGKFITLWLTPGTATPTLYIDDIEVNDISDCIDIADLAAEATGISTAAVTWRDDNNKPGTGYKIKVNKTEINPETEEAEFSFTTSEKKYDLTGLAPTTTYYIYVSPDCDDMWSATEVTTLAAFVVPYFNDFTDENTGYNANRGPKDWKWGYTYTDAPSATSSYAPYISATAWTNPPADVVKNCLYLSNSTTSSARYPYTIMPVLADNDAEGKPVSIKDLKMSFYAFTTLTANLGTAEAPIYSQLKVGVIDNLNDINKTDWFNNVTEVATVNVTESKVAQYKVIDMSSYEGTGRYIVFYQNFDDFAPGTTTSGKTNTTQIDNLSINWASAPQPVTELTVSDIKQNEAKVSWKENGIATKWEVKVFTEVPEDVETASAVLSQTVTDNPTTTITGLKHSTQYYVYARSVQDNGNGNWASTSFWTETGVFAVPFVETFNYPATGSTSNSGLPPYYETSTYAPYIRLGSSATAKELDGYLLSFQTSSTAANNICQLVFPEFDKPINTLQMTFYASTYLSSYLGDATYTQVGVLEDDGNFVEVANLTVNQAAEWEEKFINFGTYSGKGGRIAIRQDYNIKKKASYLMVDNLTIEEIPACGRITSIDVNKIDSISATIEWAKGKDEDAWNLKVSTIALDDPEIQTADIFDGQLTEQKKEITGLVGNTTYYVYVQSVDTKLDCKGGWSAPKTFKTLCQIFGFPYFEDFEGYPTGSGSLPDCSYLCGDDENHSYITTKNTGNQALYLRQATKDHNNYFAFPALKIDDVRRLQLSMQVYPGGTTVTNYYYFEVGVMTDPNDPSTFVSVYADSVQGAASTIAYDRVYTFDGYLGDDKGEMGTFIALKALHYKNPTSATYYAGYVYIDNVEIDFIETCAKPYDLVADEIGINDVTLKWETDDETAKHIVRIFDDANADPNNDSPIAQAEVNAKTATLTGLTGNTVYYAYVRKECAANDLSKWSSALEFRTECNLVTAIPYVEDFENQVANAIPFCWTNIMIKGQASQASAKTVTSAAKNGTYGLSISFTNVPSQAGGSNVGDHQAAAVTPALDVENLKDLLVYFYYRASSGTCGLKIEAVSDETIDANSMILTTIENITNEWNLAYLDLADYYTSVQPYNRLRFTPTTTGTIYIDDIVFTTEKGEVLPVANLKTLLVAENTIKFSFYEPTPTVKEWQVAYTEEGGSIEDATVITVQETEVTLTDLTPATTYDIYVRGNVEGDTWVGPLTASTFQVPSSLPYETGFEDEEDNTLWTLYNVQTVQGDFYPNFYIIGEADSCNATGTKALYVTNDSATYQSYANNAKMDFERIKHTTVATSYVWATHNLKIEAGTYKVLVKVKAPTKTNSHYVTGHLVPAGTTFKGTTMTLPSGTTRQGSATTNTNGAYCAMPQVTQTNDWVWQETQIDVEDAGIYTLAFYWYNASGVNNDPIEQPVAIDSVIVEEYLCTTPKKFEYVDRKPREVTVKWFGGACKDYEYVVSKFGNLGDPTGIELEDKVAYGTLNSGPQVTIAGLMPDNIYYLYVRTICPEGYDPNGWISYKFNTPCDIMELPYTETFVETPSCWILSNASATTVKWYPTEQDKKDGNVTELPCLSLGNNGLAILPELDIEINNIAVQLELFNGLYLTTVQLGVMDNTWDESTFQTIAYFETENKLGSSSSAGNVYIMEDFTKLMNLYTGNGKVLALKNTSGNTVYVNYIRLTELPDCVPPQQVEITYVTNDGAAVNWIAGTEDNWEIMYATKGDTTIVGVNENPYRLTGLAQGTVYSVAVRAVCDEDSKSEWSTSVTFQTECGLNKLPMFEDFSALPVGSSSDLKRAELPCWENMVSDYKYDNYLQFPQIENKPHTLPGNVYASHVWLSNWLPALGDYAQLNSYPYVTNSTYRQKWFVSPEYAIEGQAALSFDIRRCGNTGQAVPVADNNRTLVLISTDGGDTWKTEDATDLTYELDSTYQTKTISLNKYEGQNIRVAFYTEVYANTTLTTNPFILIDNVRLSCIDEYKYEDNACEGYDYEGYGFSISKDDLPLAGTDSTYVRSAESADGLSCDSLVYLTITTRTATMEIQYETICEDETFVFGGISYNTPTNETNAPYVVGVNEYGCEQITYLYLTVNPLEMSDPINVNVSKDKLPYKVDDFYTVPADAEVGSFSTYVRGAECIMNWYMVTILPATGLININQDIDVVAVRVFDCAGRMIQNIDTNGTVVETQLPAGVYMLSKLRRDGTIYTEKLIVR